VKSCGECALKNILIVFRPPVSTDYELDRLADTAEHFQQVTECQHRFATSVHAELHFHPRTLLRNNCLYGAILIP